MDLPGFCILHFYFTLIYQMHSLFTMKGSHLDLATKNIGLLMNQSTHNFKKSKIYYIYTYCDLRYVLIL